MNIVEVTHCPHSGAIPQKITRHSPKESTRSLSEKIEHTQDKLKATYRVLQDLLQKKYQYDKARYLSDRTKFKPLEKYLLSPSSSAETPPISSEKIVTTALSYFACDNEFADLLLPVLLEKKVIDESSETTPPTDEIISLAAEKLSVEEICDVVKEICSKEDILVACMGEEFYAYRQLFQVTSKIKRSLKEKKLLQIPQTPPAVAILDDLYTPLRHTQKLLKNC